MSQCGHEKKAINPVVFDHYAQVTGLIECAECKCVVGNVRYSTSENPEMFSVKLDFSPALKPKEIKELLKESFKE